MKSGRVYMLGPIIHNDHVIQSLEERGAACVSSVEEVPEGSAVIIRSHGEPSEIYRRLREKNAIIIDATCAHVARIHGIVREAEERGRIPAPGRRGVISLDALRERRRRKRRFFFENSS